MKNVITEHEPDTVLAEGQEWSNQFLREVEIVQKEKLGKVYWGGEDIWGVVVWRESGVRDLEGLLGWGNKDSVTEIWEVELVRDV